MHQPAPPTLAGGDDSVFLPMSASSDRLGLVVVKTLADCPRTPPAACPRSAQRWWRPRRSPASASPYSTVPPSPGTGQRPPPRSPPATGAGGQPGARADRRRAARRTARPGTRRGHRDRGHRRLVALGGNARRVPRRGRTDLAKRTTIAPDPRSVAAAADIICTLTPSQTPILRGAWLRPGQHVNAVGARPRPTHREMDARQWRGRRSSSTARRPRWPSPATCSGDRRRGPAARLPLRELGAVVAGGHRAAPPNRDHRLRLRRPGRPGPGPRGRRHRARPGDRGRRGSQTDRGGDPGVAA